MTWEHQRRRGSRVPAPDNERRRNRHVPPRGRQDAGPSCLQHQAGGQTRADQVLPAVSERVLSRQNAGFEKRNHYHRPYHWIGLILHVHHEHSPLHQVTARRPVASTYLLDRGATENSYTEHSRQRDHAAVSLVVLQEWWRVSLPATAESASIIQYAGMIQIV